MLEASCVQLNWYTQVYVGQKSYFAVILLPSTSMNERLTTNQSSFVQISKKIHTVGNTEMY